MKSLLVYALDRVLTGLSGTPCLGSSRIAADCGCGSGGHGSLKAVVLVFV